MLRAFKGVPLPEGRTLKKEYHFLMLNKDGSPLPSKYFEMPENGGAINYSCQLDMTIDWSAVIGAAHTHPLYRENRLNRLNKYFSAGDPSIVIIKKIPLFLRTPKGKHIKVMEIRDGWVTTREISSAKESKAKRWKSKG